MSERSMRELIKNQVTELGPLADKIDLFVEMHQLPSKLAHEVNISLDEIVSNVINYGYADGGEHLIEIRLDLTPEGLITVVEDGANPFNPLEAKDPDVSKPLEERQIGGLGIFLVKKLMDHVTYERRGERNILTMTKRINQSRG
jgi:serine/threonine-protein kinase RsbW